MARRDLFLGLSAWFSTSVACQTRQIWIAGKGIIVDNTSKANFLFSDDSSADDTVSIHKSDEYQRGEVTLFASQWIHAVVVADGCDLVAIGPYVMGPSVIKDLDAAEHKKSKMTTESVLLNHSCIGNLKDGTTGEACIEHSYATLCNWDGIEVLAHLCIPDAQLLEFMPNQDGCRVTVKAQEGFC
ncbi:telomere repeats-binding bouquet formation protein 2-like [Corticium candelabrum]|uniref:telomere repeats-binding bouquet formation protein 2-like n=1 Tax=Corticium candelabrum TaxID=121492 RepID=UPI002E2710DF|nr:telomere repeats-binding bouquet formation protein 2-like [Corticium candelabrum]